MKYFPIHSYPHFLPHPSTMSTQTFYTRRNDQYNTQHTQDYIACTSQCILLYMFRAFWQFTQFRNCVAHSVNCQIACPISKLRTFYAIWKYNNYTFSSLSESVFTLISTMYDACYASCCICGMCSLKHTV